MMMMMMTIHDAFLGSRNKNKTLQKKGKNIFAKFPANIEKERCVLKIFFEINFAMKVMCV